MIGASLVALVVLGALAIGATLYFAPEVQCLDCPCNYCTPDGCHECDCPVKPCPADCPCRKEQPIERLAVHGDPPGSEAPVVDLPEVMRQKNYLGGSCVHASTITLLRWNGRYEDADWWRANHGHGEYAQRLNAKMEARGLKYAYTTSGDERFLLWCIRTRRGAGIGYKPNHAINLVGLTASHAILLDNNRTGVYEKVPRREFFRRWKQNYGGWAWTLVYQPPPPKPWRGEIDELGR